MNKLIPLILIGVLAPEAMAIDMEYYAPNGITEVAGAFTRLALIFSDTAYQTAFVVIAVLGLLMSGVSSFIIKPLTVGVGKENPIGWFAPFVIGSVIYTAAFIPTGNMVIFDPVKNQTQTVAGVPNSIVLIAGLFNILERNMIDITDTASVYPYSRNAGGLNYQMLMDAVAKGTRNSKYYLSEDVLSYYNECGELSMALGGTSARDLKENVPSIYAILAEWVHPGVWVNMYNGDRNLNNMTCTDAWNNVLRPSLRNATIAFDPEVEAVCQKNGFNTAIVTQKQACVNLVSQAYRLHGLAPAGAGNYIREAFLAANILETVNREDPLTAQLMLAKRQLAIQGMGVMNVATDVLPNLKAVMTAIILGLIPFLTLFLVTPLYKEVLKFMVGSMLWLTTWGVMIAVTHTGAMDQAIAVFTEIELNGMGLDAFMHAETAAMKGLAIFGRMQALSLVLASAVAFAIFKFGGYAMTSLAQSQAQNLQNIGETTANQTMTADGRTGLRNSLTSGVSGEGMVQPANMPNAALHSNDMGGMGNPMAAQAKSDMARVGAGQAINESGVNVQGLTSQTGSATLGTETGNNKLVENINNNLLNRENSNENIMAVKKDMGQNNGSISMTGQQIMENANSDVLGRLDKSQKDLINDNWDSNLSVRPTFNPDGELNNLDIDEHTNVATSHTTSESDLRTVNTGSRTTTGDSSTHDDSNQRRVGGNVGMLRNAILNSGDTFKDKYTGEHDTAKTQEWGNDYSDFVQSYNNAKGGDVNAREQLVDTTAEMLNKNMSGSMSNQDLVSFYAKEDLTNSTSATAKFGTPSWLPASAQIENKTSLSLSGGSEQKTQSSEDIRTDINRAYANHIIDTSQGNGDYAERIRNTYEQQRNYSIGQGQDSDMNNDTKKN